MHADNGQATAEWERQNQRKKKRGSHQSSQHEADSMEHQCADAIAEHELGSSRNCCILTFTEIFGHALTLDSEWGWRWGYEDILGNPPTDV
jgi:hypothetical protein